MRVRWCSQPTHIPTSSVVLAIPDQWIPARTAPFESSGLEVSDREEA